MTETANFKLKKPGLTDPVDINVLNENFDTLDKEIVPMSGWVPKRYLSTGAGGVVEEADLYNNLFLSEWVTVDFVNDTEGVKFTLTEHVDGEKVLDEITAGRYPVIFFLDQNGDNTSVILNQVSVVNQDDGVRTIISATSANIFIDAYCNYNLNILKDTEGAYTVWLNVFPTLTGGAAEETKEPYISHIANVREGQVITQTLTMSDGSTVTNTINLDENDYPVSGTFNGNAWTQSWEGFDTAAESTEA